MPCYDPLRACLVEGPEGRGLVFNRRARGKALSLPCGKCIGCRLERARQWAVRIMHEAKCHEESAFVTLTYDDVHLPKSGSLDKREIQLFLKKLRARIEPTKIRFFLAGEYGEHRQRPHYHAIVFGYGFPDKVRLPSSGEHPLYESKLLSAAWGNGLASFGSVSFDSACYVANYALKKITTNREEEAKRLAGRLPEFVLMSRKPGIGRPWLEQFLGDVYPSDQVIVKGKEARPPRYYDKVLADRALMEFPPADWSKMVDGIRAKREVHASALEDIVFRSGDVIKVAPNRNARRLLVRKTVAEAKAQLKSRNVE